MKKPKWYFCATWRQNFYFFLGWEWDRFCGYLLENSNIKLTHKAPNGKCVTAPHPKSGSLYMIWTRDKIKTPDSIGILAHECLHAANYCLNERGVQHLDYDGYANDEPQAYLMQALLTSAMSRRK